MAITGNTYHYGNTDEAKTKNEQIWWITGGLGFFLLLVMMVSGVYLAQSQRVSDLKRQQTALQTEASKLSQDLAGLTAGTAPSKDISMKDWKQFCDDKRGACFMYPPNWVIANTSAGDASNVMLTDPKKRVEIAYNAPFSRDAGRITFRTVSLQDFAAPNAKVKIVGGYFVASLLTTPFYTVTNSGVAPTVIGQTFQLDGAPRFTSLNGAGDSSLQARSLTDYGATSDAKAWFASVESRTALKVLQSFKAK